MAHVHIEEIHTELTITDAVGPLSPEDLRKVLKLVMERMKASQDYADRKRADDSVGDRNYRYDVDEGHPR